MSTEDDLIDASLALGDIAEAPHWVTAGLAADVEATGRPVAELTVGELMGLAERQRERINQAFRASERDGPKGD